ncbi:hypothetical protein R1sor_021177 [Riccia sorocarpa]|uniref:Ubiquitin-like modifier-activating enzyme ATG7 n=1 Tax=Riccia sorocarpa TaxID=122646 RepID=A0ABD3GJZ4_9MARC
MGITGPSESGPSTTSGSHELDLEEAAGDGGVKEKTSTSSKLMFAPWQSAVDEGFWHQLASFKLETQRLAEHPVPVSGFFAPCSHPQVPSHLQLMEESLPTDPGGHSSESFAVQGNRNKCPVPGTLYNSNTLEGFTGLDTPSLLKITTQQIWEDIQSGRAEETSNLLNRFLLISFADLKKWSFYYWFAFPAVVITPPVTSSSCRPVSEAFDEKESTAIREACSEWRGTPATASSCFFLLHFTSGAVIARPIKDWKLAQEEGGKVIAAFYDPCNISTNPGWPLRNLLALAAARWEVKDLRVLCYREKRGFIDPQLSLIVDVQLPELPEWKAPGFLPKGVGWELNTRGKARPRSVHLAASMDPERMANEAADLNLKLMRWRLLPSLDLPTLSSTKCLLLGAGTLGCQVARGLLAWGIRHITFVDYGKVAMSNPCRQSLYNVEDCLNGGKLKVDAAADSLKRIIPGVKASGVYMSIPMPGHSVSPGEVDKVVADASRLKELVDEHDVVFLLTDTRESRWLPTLLCAEANKVAVNAALGFDTYLVMRHGAGPLSNQGEASGTTEAESSVQPGRSRLGCYFCNDVVAPLDSTANRTLDQQCTVTRPGLAPIAAALAVELAVNLLHHPLRINAPADSALSVTDNSTEPLGILPHQVRGFVAHFSQMVVVGSAFDKCTACSSIVVEEFRKRGMEFVLEVLNRPNYLEDLTGLTEMVAATQGMSLDWDDEGEFTDEES